jgi:mannosyltransferase OCH1-like enzyme
MRPQWEEARSSCQRLHPKWDFKLWQDSEANAFVHEHYPQLYSAYINYPLEIQRSNVLRYLVLDHYGGIYLDLDMRCRQPLDFLRNESFLTPPANPTGVNNAFIVSSRRHPFWQHLIHNLPRYNVNWYTPYLTNMFSTGCHFFSTMHRTYSDQAGLKILDSTHKLNGHVVTPLFEHLGASSWHKGDAKVILQLGFFVERVKRVSSLGIVYSVAIFLASTALYIASKRRNHKTPTTKYDKLLDHWDIESNL